VGVLQVVSQLAPANDDRVAQEGVEVLEDDQRRLAELPDGGERLDGVARAVLGRHVARARDPAQPFDARPDVKGLAVAAGEVLEHGVTAR